MKRRVALALLVVIPFSGMRVICVDQPTEAVATTAHIGSSDDCDRLCVIHHPANSGNDTNCSLSADASSLIVVAGIAVIPAEQTLGRPTVVPHTYIEAPQLYLEPGLAHRNPPPEA